MSYQLLAEQAQNGEVSALKAYIELKKALSEIEDAIKIVNPLAIDEAAKYNEKSFKLHGAIVEKRNSPSTWDYSECGALIQAKERVKYIEKIAQMGGGYDNVTTEEIGKAFKIEGKSIIAVKLIKE